MLSAKALVNIFLLTIIVPRIIRASIASKTVHGSEIRLNYLGAEASIIVSVVGVLCVALAMKFWMLLGGIFYSYRHFSKTQLTDNSPRYICYGLCPTCFHDVIG